ncbi:MAG TPA: hypothetical protein VMZ27_02235, partial [Candidatus Saccharimonadales bacterium]|nr:hypothetical protein [Candidatus Saccharimonadales bacterium]
MESDPNNPGFNHPEPSRETAPPPLPPVLPPLREPNSPPSGSGLPGLLSVGLALFLLDAVLSLADDSLIAFFDLHALSSIRGLVSFP